MTFLYPSFLWLLIPLGILFWTEKPKKLFSTTHLLILALIVLALSRPVIEEGLQENKISAKDIVIALDVSYSMKAKDLSPTRYDFAKETISHLLENNAKDNIMLVAFTTNPLLLSPPTTDHALIEVALKSLRPKYILTKGTSLKRLFSKLAQMPNTNKQLILMTDGGEDESLTELVDKFKKTDLHLITLALGTKKGTTVAKEDGDLLKDKEGNLVISRINPMLEKLSSAVDGDYLTAASSPEATANTLQNLIEQSTLKSEEISKMQQHHTELYQLPLLLALLLFFMLHTRASRYLLLIFALFGMQLQASVLDGYYLHNAYAAYESADFNRTVLDLKKIDTPSLQSQFAKANTFYRQQAYKKAIAVYSTIYSRSSNIKQKLYYNTANAYVMLKKYDKAREYYVKTLQLGEDKDALSNLRLVALLQEKQDAQLGIAHPKSQNSDASKNASPVSSEDKKKSREEDQPSSGSGSGGENKKEKSSDKEKKRLNMDTKEEAHPLSSKVYELINKGYIRETQPW